MKKKLILALLTALLLQLASSYALAENYPSHSCDCGENTWSTWRYSSEAQHYSFCIGCGAPEYGDHYGGMATCIAQAICEGCGSAYGTTGNKHFNMSSWEFFNDALHTRFCQDCGAPDTKEFGSHSGSNGSCIAVCDDCGSRYPDLNGKHNMSGWMPYDDTQHYRYCLDCNLSSTYEYASHTGGTATCNEQAVCEGCYATYGELDHNNHDWGDWFWLNASTHLRECRDCPASEEGKHTGGTATCMTQAICEVCNDVYGERDTTRHGEYSGWSYYNGTQHYRWCLDCSDPVSYEYEDHYGGTATCSVPAFCEGCGASYGEPDPNNHDWGDWEEFSASTHIRVCLNCVEEEEAPHTGGDGACWTTCAECGWDYSNPDGEHRNLSDWYPYSMTQHYRECLDCAGERYTEYGAHQGGDGSCRPTCEDCGAQYTDENGKHSNMCDWFYNDAAQHRRYCLDCGTYESNEYEDHYGGTATCTKRAVCEGCGTEYGERSDVHPWGEWEYLDGTNHERRCTNPDCHASDYANHSGGDGSCWTECEDCGYHYNNAEGQHRTMSVWYYLDGAQHMRHCVDCGYGQEYEDHSGGTATCQTLASCEVCGESYGEYDSDTHVWEQWMPDNGNPYIHTRTCQHNASHTESESHYGGDSSCRPLCEGCGAQYPNENGEHRNMSDWNPFSAVQHARYCLDCKDITSYEYADHTGSDGTCSPTCEVCGSRYPDLNGQHMHMSVWESVSDTQHTRICTDCYRVESIEYGNHSGGTATCTEDGVCEVCKAAYIPALQHSWGEWKPNGNGTHTRVCANDADHTETDDCSGGDGSCRPTCEGCGTQYNDANGEHRNMSEWFPYSGTQHFRYCKDCDQDEYANHHGGDGSCTPVCADCSMLYSDENGEHRNVTDWIFINNDRHFRYCPDCGSSSSYEYADHSGGKANCTEKAVCEDCGKGYGELAPDDHDWGEWKSNGNGTHTRVCTNDATHTDTDDCTGGFATCTEDGVCEVCDSAYMSAINHSWGEWKSNGNGTHTRVCANDADHTETEDCTGGKASCTEDGVCEVCEAAYIPAIQHSWGEWKSNGDGTHTRVCANDADHTETEGCTGGTATCTDKAICEVCGSEHGAALGHIPGAEADCTNDQFCTREGCGELLTEKLGHDYTAVVTKPTCTENGYTTYTCSRCEESYQVDQTAARGHWYDLWYPNQDGTHSAKCKRYGCRHEGTTECTLYEITVKDGESETILTVCPVCGDHETATLSVMSGATIKNVFINQPIPHGEQIVRELDAPFNGVLYAFTAAYELAGRVVPFNGKVSVSLPLDAEKYAEFRLVRVDVTPATETTERAEVWTDAAFTFENGRLTFETDVAGLFLLVPME